MDAMRRTTTSKAGGRLRWYDYLLLTALGLAIAFSCATAGSSYVLSHRPPTTPPLSPSVFIGDANGHGSGVSIGHGYIITAAHVAKDKPIVQVKSATGYVQPGTVLWTNPVYDIALVRVPSAASLGSAPLNCAPLRTGQSIFANGSPQEIEFLTTTGTVAGEARKYGAWESVVPVAITILPGMSGGGVLSAANELVGISVGVMTFGPFPSVTGIGYIVPATVVCDLLATTANIARP